MECKISIRGKEYTLRHCVRARIISESITGQMWTVATMTGQYNYFYGCILAGTKKCDLKYDDFLDALDENPAIMHEFQEFMTKALQVEASFYKKPDGGENPENTDGQKN